MFLHVFFAVFVSALSFFIPVMPFSFHQESPAAPNEAAYAELPSVATPPVPAATSTAGVDVPILVYHIVRPSYLGDDAAVRAIALTPGTFDAELLHLQSAGYHVVSFRNLEAYFASSTPLPTKPVILSFDDAWGDQYHYAFPVLEKYHDTATFFVFTNALDSRGFLTWTELHAMVAAGMTVGDHSKSHPYFAHLTATSSLMSEIVDTKRVLETKLGVPVIAFAYPFGQYNARVLEYVKKAGFAFGRGDSWHGPDVSPATRYVLSAMNAPTSLSEFAQRFP